MDFGVVDTEKISIIGVLVTVLTTGGVWVNGLLKKKDLTIANKDKTIEEKDNYIKEMYVHMQSMHNKLLEVVNKNTAVSEKQISALDANTKSSDELKKTISDYMFRAIDRKN